MEDFEIEIPEIDIEIPEMEEEIIECDMEAEMEEETGNVEETEEEYERKKARLRKVQNPNRQIPQKSKGSRTVLIKVKDYIRCSVLTLTFCNVFFLGSAAMMCSLQAMKRKFKRDIKGARKYSQCAFCANIMAVILTIIMTILLTIILFNRSGVQPLCDYFQGK